MDTFRASDSEREAVARILQKAAGAGRLSPEEAGERLAQAGAARFREELNGLIADLPEASELRSPVEYRRAPHWSMLLWGTLRVGVAALLFIGLSGFFLRWFLFPFWPLALVFLGAFVIRRRWRWHRRIYSSRPYWRMTRYGF